MDVTPLHRPFRALFCSRSIPRVPAPASRALPPWALLPRAFSAHGWMSQTLQPSAFLPLLNRCCQGSPNPKASSPFFLPHQIVAVRATQTPKHQVHFSPSAQAPRCQVDFALSAHAPKGQVDFSPSDQAPKGRSSKAQGVNPGISRNNLKALKGRRSRSSRPDGFLRGGRARCSASGSGRYRSGSGPRRSLSEKRRASAEKCKARTPAIEPDAHTMRMWSG